MKINILIPMAGAGSRFSTEHWHQTKPLIDIQGSPMFEHVIRNLDSPIFEINWIFIVRQGFPVNGGKINWNFISTNELLQGSVCSCLLAKNLIDNDTPLMIANSDQIILFDKDKVYRQIKKEFENGEFDGFVFTFKPDILDNKWSYVQVENGLIIRTVEKQVISDTATVGIYLWRHGRDFIQAAEKMIAAKDVTNNEYYTAPCYNYGTGRYKPLSIEKMYGIGIPADLISYMRNLRTLKTVSVKTNDKRLIISHRANLNGPSPEENNPEKIRKVLSMGYHVECDLQLIDNELWLGHDHPEYKIDYDFLLQNNLIVHCKNIDSLDLISKDPRIHCFSHNLDDVVLTSRNIPWVYPNKKVTKNSIACMFDNDNLDVYGICTDYPEKMSTRTPTNKIDAIVFDLDGTLVETKEIHQKAFNQAILKIAGEKYVITNLEDYEAMTTLQKLRKLNLTKNMPVEFNKKIWDLKQELTNQFIEQELIIDNRLVTELTKIKAFGYPIGVASNCIRSTVDLILKKIGIYSLIDVSISNNDVENPKPAPDMYQRIAKSFGTSPDRLLVVEDSHVGFVSAILAETKLLKVDSPKMITADLILQKADQINCEPEEYNIVIPLAGICSRYQDQDIPFWLEEIREKPLITHIVESLLSNKFSQRFIFVVYGNYNADSVLIKSTGYRPTKIIKLDSPTAGSMMTVEKAIQYLNQSPILVCDGSHIISWKPGDSIDTILICRKDGALTTINSSDPRWSYIFTEKMNSKEINPPQISVVAKNKISNLACTGLYYFKEKHVLKSSIEKCRKEKMVINGNYYISSAFNFIDTELIPVDQMFSLRTTEERNIFSDYDFMNTRLIFYQKKYQEMETKWKNTIYRWTDVLSDRRKCVASFCMATKDNFTGDISHILNQFKEHFLYLPNKNLHFTLFKYTDFQETPKMIDTESLTSFLSGIKFNIVFNKVIITDCSVIMVGVPDIDVESMRSKLRRHISSGPKNQDICHMTLVRFTQPVINQVTFNVKAELRIDNIRTELCDYSMLNA